MVKCVCGKEIEQVPSWLSDVKITFICNNCPTRDMPGITEVDLTDGKAEEEAAAAAKAEEEKKAEATKAAKS